MTMIAGERIFVDTNVLIYALNAAEPRHAVSRTKLLELEEADNQLWISRQVIREFMGVMSRGDESRRAASADELLLMCRALEERFLLAEDQDVVTQQLYLLCGAATVAGKQIHDANIVATMLAYDIRALFTFNVSDFRRWGTLIQILAD